MRRTGLFIVLAAVAALGGSAVLAQNPHLIREPSIRQVGNELRVSGRIAGLGSEPLNVSVVADAVIDVDCRNPGGNIAPGQRTTTTALGETGAVTPDRHGRYDFNITVTPATPSAAEVCPNPKWEVVIREVTFSNVRIFVEQPIGSQPRQLFP